MQSCSIAFTPSGLRPLTRERERVLMLSRSLGWVGAVGTVGAYGLVSHASAGRASRMRFQAINVVGAGLLALSASTAANWPSMVSNLVWMYFGLHTLGERSATFLLPPWCSGAARCGLPGRCTVFARPRPNPVPPRHPTRSPSQPDSVPRTSRPASSVRWRSGGVAEWRGRHRAGPASAWLNRRCPRARRDPTTGPGGGPSTFEPSGLGHCDLVPAAPETSVVTAPALPPPTCSTAAACALAAADPVTGFSSASCAGVPCAGKLPRVCWVAPSPEAVDEIATAGGARGGGGGRASACEHSTPDGSRDQQTRRCAPTGQAAAGRFHVVHCSSFMLAAPVAAHGAEPRRAACRDHRVAPVPGLSIASRRRGAMTSGLPSALQPEGSARAGDCVARPSSGRDIPACRRRARGACGPWRG